MKTLAFELAERGMYLPFSMSLNPCSSEHSGRHSFAIFRFASKKQFRESLTGFRFQNAVLHPERYFTHDHLPDASTRPSKMCVALKWH